MWSSAVYLHNMIQFSGKRHDFTKIAWHNNITYRYVALLFKYQILSIYYASFNYLYYFYFFYKHLSSNKNSAFRVLLYKSKLFVQVLNI